MIDVSGRANGGLHEMLTLNESMKTKDKSPTEIGSVEFLTCNYNILFDFINSVFQLYACNMINIIASKNN